MRRTIFIAWAALLCGLGLCALALSGPGQATASMPVPPSSAGANPPFVPCVYTPVQLSLVGTGVIEDRRPFTIAVGESYLQFVPAPPITTTATSSGYALFNGGWSGQVQGDITGDFAAANLSGLAVTGSTVSPEGRGFEVNEIVIHGATGTITALLAINFAATTAIEPFYPRNVSGYLHSTATIGSYAPYKFEGEISGTLGPPSGGTAPLNASIQGRLYTGGSTNFSMISSARRELPSPRGVTFQPSDVLAQFRRADFPVNTTVGRVEPVAVFHGQSNPNITTTISLDHESLLLNGGTINDNGWLAGNWRMSASNGDRFEGPWLGDLPDVGLHSYLFLVQGTGGYANSLLFATFDGAISYNGGTDIAGGGGGVYCDGMQPAGTPTPEGTATNTPTYTSTPTETYSPTITSTPSSTCGPDENDLVASLYWADSGQCQQFQSLYMVTRLIGVGPVTTTTMRLIDRLGYFHEIFVPPLSNNDSYTSRLYANQVGSPPLTLTVDYYDVVVECNEGNNDYSVNYIAATRTPCPTDTRTPSNTPTYTYTAVPTFTPALTFTPTQTFTPTAVPTEGILCYVEISATTTGCVPPFTYDDTFTFSTYCEAGPGTLGSLTVYFEVASGSGGPWTVIDQQLFTMWFPVGTTSYGNEFTESEIPAQYTWYRMRLVGNYGGGWRLLEGQTDAALICSPRETPTPTSTLTPCARFTDVHPTDYFYTAVMYLACHGVISGYSDGTFRPYNTTTRGQLCKIVVLAEGWPLNCPLPGHFTDVPPDHPFFCYIETMFNRGGGIITGYGDGTFRPGSSVTRGQLCKIIVLAQGWMLDCPTVGHFTDVPPGSTFFCYMETAYEHGIISGYADGTFHPYSDTTRGQISKIVYQAVTGP